MCVHGKSVSLYHNLCVLLGEESTVIVTHLSSEGWCIVNLYNVYNISIVKYIPGGNND